MSSEKSLFRRKTIAAILQNPPADHEGHASPGGLERHLTVRDLTALGIAAIIGAGIFSTIGKASLDGGPAVSLLFVFTAVACAFSALCAHRCRKGWVHHQSLDGRSKR